MAGSDEQQHGSAGGAGGGIASPSHLEPSELGTREYWDELYTREMRNHADDPSDTGTAWFDDSGAEERMRGFLLDEADPPLDQAGTAVLDLGTGNGALLFGLRDDGWTGRMLGVDYSERSVQFARAVAASRRRDQQQQQQQQEEEEEEEEEEGQAGREGGADADVDDDGDVGGGRRAVVSAADDPQFALHDLLHSPPDALLTGAQAAGWDVVLDKGTFDAVSLSPELLPGRPDDSAAGRPRRVAEAYLDRVLPLVREGGLFLVTSCNWTESELAAWFLGPDQRGPPEAAAAATGDDESHAQTQQQQQMSIGPWRFQQVGRIEYPSFSFGGVKGQTISTLCFRKVRTVENV